MERTEQAEFVTELIDRVKAELLSKVTKVPDTWDGHELRQWIADAFSGQVYTLTKTRKREYNNEILIRNI